MFSQIEKIIDIIMVFYKKITITLILVLFCIKGFAQEPNFSMYHYSPFFTNPGRVGLVEDVRLMLNYRSQAIEAGENFRTSSFSGYYPLYIGHHRLVLAGNFLNDQASDFVKTNGALLGVGYAIRVGTKSELSLGLQAGYFQRKIDIDFITDDQFVNGVFDPNAVSSDAALMERRGYPTLSGGIHYQVKDEAGREKAFIGGSIFNANQPNTSFFDTNAVDPLPSSIKVTAGYRVYQGLNFSILPNLRWVNQTDNSYFNIGSRFGYELEKTGEGIKKIELGLWYNTNDLGVFSLAYEQPNMIIGISYDIPAGIELNTGQNGIFELAISFRLKKKDKMHTLPQDISANPSPNDDNLQKEEKEEIEDDVEIIKDEEENKPQPTPLLEESSETATVAPNQEGNEPAKEAVHPEPEVKKENVVLTTEEQKVLAGTLRFKLDSDELTDESKQHLEEVLAIMKKNEWLQLELVGHTCDLGAEHMNTNLSLERAKKAGQYLSGQGISNSRFIVKGEGEKNPIDTTQTEEGRRKNRRVEFKVK